MDMPQHSIQCAACLDTAFPMSVRDRQQGILQVNPAMLQIKCFPPLESAGNFADTVYGRKVSLHVPP
jgi:hypothetical protein